MTDIDISVYMTTYYHENYIEQAIESVLTQETRFSYEIVICDDCSQDKTREILQQYQEKYPDIIRLFLNEKNLGIPRNVFQARCECRGKYIVQLSGDDYWINNAKLEIEGSFLEKHPEYIAVFNGIELRYDDSDTPYDTVPKKSERNREFTIKDYEDGAVLRSHGFMMRNEFLSSEGRAYFRQAQIISDKVDDAVDVVLLMKRGRVFIIDAVTDAHRVAKIEKEKKHNYNSKFSRIEKFRQYVELLNAMDKHFNTDSIEVDFRKKYVSALTVAEIDMVMSGKYKSYYDIFKTIPTKYIKSGFDNIYIITIPEIVRFGANRLNNHVKSRRQNKNSNTSSFAMRRNKK